MPVQFEEFSCWRRMCGFVVVMMLIVLGRCEVAPHDDVARRCCRASMAATSASSIASVAVWHRPILTVRRYPSATSHLARRSLRVKALRDRIEPRADCVRLHHSCVVLSMDCRLLPPQVPANVQQSVAAQRLKLRRRPRSKSRNKEVQALDSRARHVAGSHCSGVASSR